MSDNEETIEPVSRQLLIHGKVQGVAYRAHAQREASRLGLNGWVRNRASGEVEALIAGVPEAVEAFIDWARQGPPAARVARIEIAAADAPEREGFTIAPDSSPDIP